MTMGQTGMADMGEMGMPVPPNSIPMLGGRGSTIPSRWEGCSPSSRCATGSRSYKDPGWYGNPPDTLASTAPGADLRRDGIDVEHPPAAEDDGPV